MAVGLAPAGAVDGETPIEAVAAATVTIDVGGTHACSGALLNTLWVITAKSCFGEDVPADGAPTQVTKVTVGRVDLSGTDGAVVPVERVVAHPDRDVVLALLAKPVDDAGAVAVTSTAPVAGEKLTIAGYGRTSTELVPDTAHAATFSVAAVHEGTIDIEPDQDGATVCKGDAGGPTLRGTTGGAVELVAIHHTAHQGGCLGQTTTARGATETRLDDIRQWIGWNAKPTQGPPVGNIEAVVPNTGQVTISGWAWDPDTAAPIDVRVEIDGASAVARADLDRPDVSATLDTAPTRGFSHTRKLAPGNHRACVHAVNTGKGENVLLGCRDFSTDTKTPIGHVDSVVADGGQVTITGWAWDPDTTAPIDVHVYIDGVGAAVRADLNRPDVAKAYATTATRGFTHTRTLAPGNHTMCVYGINTGPGGNPVLGCRDFSTDTKTPIGHVDSVVPDVGQVTITGWAWDPDTTAPIDVHVYIDGVGAAVRADLDRPDVAAAYGTTATRGFSYTRKLAPGDHTMCVYGINTGPGGNPVLGCRDFSVDTKTPIGHVDSVSVNGGQVTITGWAWDPDTPSPTDVHIYIDGVGAAMRAGLSRPDVAAIYGTTATRGFSHTRVVSPGSHSVCVYAINIGAGGNPTIGCHTFSS